LICNVNIQFTAETMVKLVARVAGGLAMVARYCYGNSMIICPFVLSVVSNCSLK